MTIMTSEVVGVKISKRHLAVFSALMLSAWERERMIRINPLPFHVYVKITEQIHNNMFAMLRVKRPFIQQGNHVFLNGDVIYIFRMTRDS